jgi:cell division protein FtsI/penicillin-binding protein 2
MKRMNGMRVLLASAGMLVFTACSGIVGPDSAGGGGPLIQVMRTPEETVSAFLNAWGSRDYDAMYPQLSSQSQQLTSAAVFRAVYEDADNKIGTSGLTVTIQDVEIQGQSAAVKYDAQISSSIFGTIEDDGRTMRLVEAPNGWGVAWSTMDIFDGYAGGAQLNADVRRDPRGNIYDRNGELLVEQDGTITQLFIVKNEVSDLDACLPLLAGVLHQQTGDLAAFLAPYDGVTIVPVGEIDPEEFAARSGELTSTCSIRSATREGRRYVGHGAAVHVTGYEAQIPVEDAESYEQRGYGAGDLVGRGGIEEQYEEQLAGEASRVLRITEPGGLLIRELAGAEGSSPQSVTLTLDRNLQLAAAQALADAYNYAEGNWAGREHSTGAGVVVLDVNSGAVLALASYPMYDPGLFDPNYPLFNLGTYIAALGTDARQPFFNRVVQNSYAPGSTFKIITTAAAADTRVWNPDDIFYCPRVWPNGAQYGDTLPERFDWRNFETAPEANFDTGDVTMSEALTASCNPFFYEMGGRLYQRGESTLRDYARRMGLGERTGFDLTLPAEVPGNLDVPQGPDAAISQAIGQQDTQVSILQMARMVAGVANGGTLYEPYVVQSVGIEGATPTYEAELQIAGEMGLSEEVLDVIRNGMCMVTDHDVVGRTSGQPIGTAWFAFDDPEWYPASYTVCGKTGTAQTGEIEPHGWFVAFAPADDPQIAIAAMVEYSREGSETAAPIVRRILDTYFQVPEDQVMPYYGWWIENPYEPLNIPEGSTGV